jgi:transcriptional regulator with XRE-family HTH domain
MEISERIYKARKEKGITQKVLAINTNLSLSTIKRLENGKVKPRAHTLNVLSNVLEVNLFSDQIENTDNEDGFILVILSIFLLIFPPLNIIFLLFVRAKDPHLVNKLLVSQTLSLIIYILAVFFGMVITYTITGHKIYDQFNTPLVFYILLIVYNLYKGFSLLDSSQLQNDTLMTP